MTTAMQEQKQETNQTRPLRAIETPWARTALWKLAESLPAVLLEMAETEPEELLADIERSVERATEWMQTAIRNGADESEAQEIALTLLDPSYVPEEPEMIEITEAQMTEIYEKLLKIAGITG